MNMKLIYIYLTVLSLVMLISCGAGKNYQRPSLNMPDSYRKQLVIQEKTDTLAYQPQEFFTNKLLLALIDTAFVKNNDLLTAIKNIELAQSVLRTVKLNYLPDLTAQINGTYSHASKNSAAGQAGSRVSENYNLSLGLNWDIDIWGRIRREKQEALASYLQTEEVRKTVQMRLVADVARAYYNLLMLDKQLGIANRSKELSDSTLQIMQLQYKVGDANSLGIQQITAQVEQNKLLISQIEQSIASQENALSLLCGNYAQSIERRFEPDAEFKESSADGLPVAILTKRPDVKAAEYALMAANARVGIRQAAMYPSLNINASGGLNSLATSNWFNIPASLFGTVAGGLTQPIFNKRRLKEQYEQAKIEREKEVINFRQAVLQAYSQTSDALKNREEIEKQYLFAKNREQALFGGIRSTNLLFQTGNVTYLEVITVQMNYLQAQLDAVSLYVNEINANISLFHSLGGGWKQQNK